MHNLSQSPIINYEGHSPLPRLITMTGSASPVVRAIVSAHYSSTSPHTLEPRSASGYRSNDRLRRWWSLDSRLASVAGGATFHRNACLGDDVLSIEFSELSARIPIPPYELSEIDAPGSNTSACVVSHFIGSESSSFQTPSDCGGNRTA